MKKLLLTLALVGGVISFASAQKMNIGVNGAAAMPLGDFGDAATFGGGADLSLDYYFNDLFDMGIETGYKYFGGELEGSSFSVIPAQLTAGFHTDIDDWIDLYGELGGGLFIVSSEYELGGTTFSSSDNFGGISPRVGMAFELNSEWFLDVNVNYTHIFAKDETIGRPDYNWVGLNLGILYTIGEW